MPGVPSGRGCEACRKQKKKCDQAQPNCSRCSRLKINCIGAGQRRFIFAELKFATSRDGAYKKLPSKEGPCLSREPSNELTALMNAFVMTIKPSTHQRFNLVWAYGSFLEHIPSRLGTNTALDASIPVLTEAHANLCCRNGVTTSSLLKYSHALEELRLTLDSPDLATSTETLCAVMILSICQSFLGSGGGPLSHTTGMARILKYRGLSYDPHNAFESDLFLTLRGPVVFEALWNDDIQFTDPEWQTLVAHQSNNNDRPEGKLMQCMALVPAFLRTGRALGEDVWQDPYFSYQILNNYRIMQLASMELGERLDTIQRKMHDGATKIGSLFDAQFALSRLYALALAVTVVFGCLVSTTVGRTAGLSGELHAYAVEILGLSQLLNQYRPIGGSVMSLCLGLAWTGAADVHLRTCIESTIKEYMGDFPNSESGNTFINSLDYLERRWKFVV